MLILPPVDFHQSLHQQADPPMPPLLSRPAKEKDVEACKIMVNLSSILLLLLVLNAQVQELGLALKGEVAVVR